MYVSCTTEVFKTLHENFKEPIDCPKHHDLTSDKCKELIQEQKTKLRGIIGRYNRSGNGSDMAQFDEDTDNEDDDEIVENEDTYGRFNAEQAARRALCREGVMPNI